MKPVERIWNKMKLKNLLSTLAELFKFLKSRGKLWLAPFVTMLALIGGLIVVAEGSVVAPFIYTLF